MSSFSIRAESVLGEIFLRFGSESGPVRAARAWAMAMESRDSKAVMAGSWPFHFSLVAIALAVATSSVVSFWS